MAHSSVALLVDGDNLSAHYGDKLIREASSLGPLTIRRIYCNDTSLASWSEAHSFRRIHKGNGKNTSDILLSIDAMEMELTQGIEAFAIASSDCDFSHIAHRLREIGKHVTGLGANQAPKAFRLACDSFTELAPRLTKRNEVDLSPIDKAVCAVLEEHDPKGQGILLSRLNGMVRRKNASIKISELKEKTWPKYLSSRGNMYHVTGQGAERYVRIATSQSDS